MVEQKRKLLIMGRLQDSNRATCFSDSEELFRASHDYQLFNLTPNPLALAIHAEVLKTVGLGAGVQ